MRLALMLALFAGAASGATPATLRVDLQHGGDARQEHYALERVVLEPLPWPGNPARPIDDSNRGTHLFRVFDEASGALLYSRGYSTVFEEWRSTEEAGALQRSFQESLRFPRPAGPVRLQVLARGEGNAFVPAWEARIDPEALDVERVPAPAPAQAVLLHGEDDPPHKVDLLVLGEGYAAGEMARFQADARRATDALLAVSPFRERAADLSVRALAVPVPESGVSRPSTGRHRAGSIGLRYDIFGSERYALSLDNRAWRGLAQYAPYDVVLIVFNSDTYGGGGIFGQFSTAAAGSAWFDYLVVHEFGHHFAGLADEYYTSPVAYQPSAGRPEPWEPNATALADPARLKWRDHVAPSTPVPTPWPKAAFEAFQRDNQARRAALRAERRPEAEMDALFRAEQAFVDGLFDGQPHVGEVGAFEGANYAASGYYRPQMQCLMFTRHDAFCAVCRDAVEAIIDLYARPAP